MDTKVVLQHNAITTARYDMSSAEKNIIYLLLTKLQENDPMDKKYVLRVQELMDATDHVIDYKQFKLATEKLIGKVLTINENHGFLQVSISSSARYLLNSGTIELRIDPTLRPYLFALKNNFTSFNAEMAIKLRSKYAKRIYEMLSQYKDTGIMKISIHELKSRLDLLNVVSKKEKYIKYSMFTRKVLEIAKKELFTKTNIEFVYTPQKTGKKYTDIEFKIKKNPSKKVGQNVILNINNSELTPHVISRIDRMHTKF